MRNLRTALAAAGAGPEHVVKWNIVVVDGQDFGSGYAAFQRARGDRPNPPVITAAVVKGAVMAVDHCEAGAHVAGEIEGGDAGTKREGGEGVPEIVDPAQGLDPGGELGGLPVAVPEVVQVEVAPALGREEKRAVRTWWLVFERVARLDPCGFALRNS